MTMTIQLAAPIAGYFAADERGDADAVAAWFTEDAVVKDEGKENHGRDAIRMWKSTASKAFSYAVEPFAVVSDGDRATVTSRVTGDFPGSPIDLRYLFVLREGKIAALEIVS
jgi:ketosteroid isomerase-like protein